MKGLLIKDFFVIGKQLKFSLVVIPIMAIIGDPSLASIAILFGAMLPMTAMAYDEQSKWNELAMMMPYSKMNIVLSKYLLGYICMAGTTALFLVVKCISTLITSGDLTQNLYLIFIAVLSGLFFIAVNVPVLFKYGTQKGRFIFILFVGISVAVGVIVKNIFPEISTTLINSVPLLALAVALILNVVSVFISMRIKRA